MCHSYREILKRQTSTTSAVSFLTYRAGFHFTVGLYLLRSQPKSGIQKRARNIYSAVRHLRNACKAGIKPAVSLLGDVYSELHDEKSLKLAFDLYEEGASVRTDANSKFKLA